MPSTDFVSIWGMASDLEVMVGEYLARQDIAFEFQSQLIGGFGGQDIGDAKVDFILRDRMLAIRVQGEYWHKQPDVEAKDLLQKERLKAMGWAVVDLWTDDIKNNLEEAMRHALIGEEMP
jgi:very-short-patch-repair endonuclease